MKYKYFGTIRPEDLEPLYSKKSESFLFNKGLLEQCFSVSGEDAKPTKVIGETRTVVEISDRNLSYKYTDDLAVSVFEFLLERYKDLIGTEKVLFNRDFKNESFGLSKDEKKKIGLAHFNRHFDFAIGDTEIGLEYNKEGEIFAENRFKTLFDIRESFKNHLKEQNSLVIAYLIGYLNFFDRELYESNPYLKQIFKFENILSILISLNREFQFEKEDIFTPKSIAETIYEDYQGVFESLEQLQFIEKQILKQKVVKRALILSLFDLFSNELTLKIPSGELFGKIINFHYNFKFGVIKLNGYESVTHINRVKILKKEWEIFLD